MKIDDHLYRANRLISSAEFLKSMQHLKEATWIYGLAGTHLFNSALHVLGVTLWNQGLPTHNAGYFCDPADLSKVSYSNTGDVIHADMPSLPLTGLAKHMKEDLLSIEAVAVGALHRDISVSHGEVEIVARLVLSLKENTEELLSDGDEKGRYR